VTSGGSPRARGPAAWARWAAAGAAAFTLALAYSAASGFGRADESWFLRVVDRVLAGEVLYRDVFLGVTPLSVFLVAPLAALFGTEVLVVKAAVALCVAATAVIGAGICRQLGAGWRPAAAFAASVFVYVMPGLTRLGSPYSGLALALLLACLACTLRWLRDEGAAVGWRALAAAGAAAGLCFTAKQNVGVYAMAALVVAVFAASRGAGPREVLRRLALVAGAFAGAVLLVIAPVAASGGLEALVDYGFTGKGAYLRAGRIPYGAGMGELLSVLADPPRRLSSRFIFQHQFALPFVAFPVMLAAWWRVEPQLRLRSAVLLLFAGAGFLGVFPRASESHLSLGNPLLLLGLVHGWGQLRGPAARLSGMCAAAWVGLLLAVTLAMPLRAVASGRLVVSRLPHFRGVMVGPGLAPRSLSRARELKLAATDGEIFLLSAEAGFYYLVTGLKNPTPYDYPMVTTFGTAGEARVEAMLRGGRIRTACVDPATPPLLRSERVENAVRTHLRFTRQTRLCSLYRG
jgi:hypothetical protein